MKFYYVKYKRKRKMRKTILLSFVLILITGALAQAATYRVPDHYPDIQAAIDDANDCDTVIVSPGTYQGNINFNGKNIVLTGTNPDDPEIVAATIINGDGQSSVVTFANGETSEAVLSGFTISGGYGTLFDEEAIFGRDAMIIGGGIYCLNSSPTIKKNVITNNNSETAEELLGIESWGGGIGCLGSSATIINNIIKNNSAVIGGGVLVAVGDAEVSNNLIYENSATAGGGVIMVASRLINNTIVNNYAESGGNTYLVSYPEFGSCTAVSNIMSNARGSGSLYREGTTPQDQVRFNNVWDDTGDPYISGRKKADFGSNISDDPIFVNLQANDFRLQMDSPCINTGDPNYSIEPDEKDFYGTSRVIHDRIDIGAAEFLGNLRPVADVGDDKSTVELPESIVLDGSDSYDPDGNTNLTYKWSQISGPSVTIENDDTSIAKFTPDRFGVYSFELVVGDGVIESFPDDVTIIIGTTHIPVADAGLPFYTEGNDVVLDGTKSFDPDNSGELLYYWQQVSGPAVVITDSNTATPTIKSFVQTDSLQLCEFQLVVYDGQSESVPDIAKVWIMPISNGTVMHLENDGPFDPNKPTIVYFGGGDCITGGGSWSSSYWEERANVFYFGYQPDDREGPLTYYKCGDLLIQYLSSVAPNYNQPIQTMGHSTGGQPTIDVGLRLNLTYKDPRYAVNRVSFLDGRCRDYSSSIDAFLESSVDSEQCWIDTYEGSGPYFYPGILNVQVAQNNHGAPPQWYKDSLMNPNKNQFNGGIVAGAYWSVIGPGKNLQLAMAPDRAIYMFNWEGTDNAGDMNFYDENNYPARLPEPVTLLDPVDAGVPGGVVLTCQESENAIGYQLLFGADPHRVMDYEIVSDTPTPPSEVITTLPFEETWWTVKVYDRYGSTIYADPMPIHAINLTMPVLNMNTGKRYAYIQDAIDEAALGDEIVLGEGTYHENVDVEGKDVIIRSSNPDDPAVVKATVINGRGQDAALTISGSGNCAIRGLTITNGNNGIYCSDNSSVTVNNCVVTGNKKAGIKLWDKGNLTITNSIIFDNAGAGIELYQLLTRKPNIAVITNCTITGNLKQGVWGGQPTIQNSIIYFNGGRYDGVQIESDLAEISYSDIQGGWADESDGNIDADPLFADAANGDYHLKSQAGRYEPVSDNWIQDEVTSPCIDAGNPDSDFSAEPMPNGGRINMGAYGGTSQASISTSPIGGGID
jgi:azurin